MPINITYAEKFAEDHWDEIATRAVSNKQTENDFLLSCHVANRPAALKAYRRAQQKQDRANCPAPSHYSPSDDSHNTKILILADCGWCGEPVVVRS